MAFLARATAAAGFLGGLLLSPPLLAEDQTPAPGAVVPEPAARLSISSDSPCPSQAAIAAELAALLPPAEWPSGTVRVRATSDKLLVELVADTATQRELAATEDCGMRAITVALVIATWTGELSAASEPALRSNSEPREPPPALLAPPAVPVASLHERELGAGLLLSVSGGLAPGITIDFVQTRAPRGLGWQAGLTLPAQRELSGMGGSTHWTRAAASVAVNGRITLPPVALSTAAGLVAAYTLTSGRGYPVEQDMQALTGGIMAEARAAIPWGRLRVWTGLRGFRWLWVQSVVIETQGGDRVASGDLPSWDFQWVVGLGYVFR
jgi:hypothetical protein